MIMVDHDMIIVMNMITSCFWLVETHAATKVCDSAVRRAVVGQVAVSSCESLGARNR